VTAIGDLPNGLAVVVKRDCETCVLIAPVLRELAADGLTVISQDDPDFPEGMDVIDDSDLHISWELGTEVTPTLYRIRDGVAVELAVGWRRSEWRGYSKHPDLGASLPEHRPGCGSRTQEPAEWRRLSGEAGADLTSRRIELGAEEDPIEAMYARGWSDGLPLTPPTPSRVAAMLAGTTRAPEDLVADVAPNYAPATVEKVAINAVMAGCLPEYLPVVIAAVEAITAEPFNLHGVAATTFFSGPILIVNGPIAAEIGMNATYNAFGPGNRANATIGRAVNLVVRNIGGAKPAGVDRSTMGHPAKWTLCIAEREDDSPWPSLATARGVGPGISAVTAMAGQGPTPVVDQLARDPESLARTFAASLQAVGNVKHAGAWDAMIAMSPEHVRVFASGGWSREHALARIHQLTRRPASEMQRGAGGIAEGLPAARIDSLITEDGSIPKFAADGLELVRVGSDAGLFSGILSSWARGPRGSMMVTRPIGP
jgi:hypothetical protein